MSSSTAASTSPGREQVKRCLPPNRGTDDQAQAHRRHTDQNWVMRYRPNRSPPLYRWPALYKSLFDVLILFAAVL